MLREKQAYRRSGPVAYRSLRAESSRTLSERYDVDSLIPGLHLDYAHDGPAAGG
jgi:hypothetical protein